MSASKPSSDKSKDPTTTEGIPLQQIQVFNQTAVNKPCKCCPSAGGNASDQNGKSANKQQRFDKNNESQKGEQCACPEKAQKKPPPKPYTNKTNAGPLPIMVEACTCCGPEAEKQSFKQQTHESNTNCGCKCSPDKDKSPPPPPPPPPPPSQKSCCCELISTTSLPTISLNQLAACQASVAKCKQVDNCTQEQQNGCVESCTETSQRSITVESCSSPELCTEKNKEPHNFKMVNQNQQQKPVQQRECACGESSDDKKESKNDGPEQPRLCLCKQITDGYFCVPGSSASLPEPSPSCQKPIEAKKLCVCSTGTDTIDDQQDYNGFRNNRNNNNKCSIPTINYLTQSANTESRPTQKEARRCSQVVTTPPWICRIDGVNNCWRSMLACGGKMVGLRGGSPTQCNCPSGQCKPNCPKYLEQQPSQLACGPPVCGCGAPDCKRKGPDAGPLPCSAPVSAPGTVPCSAPGSTPGTAPGTNPQSLHTMQSGKSGSQTAPALPPVQEVPVSTCTCADETPCKPKCQERKQAARQYAAEMGAKDPTAPTSANTTQPTSAMGSRKPSTIESQPPSSNKASQHAVSEQPSSAKASQRASTVATQPTSAAPSQKASTVPSQRVTVVPSQLTSAVPSQLPSQMVRAPCACPDLFCHPACQDPNLQAENPSNCAPKQPAEKPPCICPPEESPPAATATCICPPVECAPNAAPGTVPVSAQGSKMAAPASCICPPVECAPGAAPGSTPGTVPVSSQGSKMAAPASCICPPVECAPGTAPGTMPPSNRGSVMASNNPPGATACICMPGGAPSAMSGIVPGSVPGTQPGTMPNSRRPSQGGSACLNVPTVCEVYSSDASKNPSGKVTYSLPASAVPSSQGGGGGGTCITDPTKSCASANQPRGCLEDSSKSCNVNPAESAKGPCGICVAPAPPPEPEMLKGPCGICNAPAPAPQPEPETLKGPCGICDAPAPAPQPEPEMLKGPCGICTAPMPPPEPEVKGPCGICVAPPQSQNPSQQPMPQDDPSLQCNCTTAKCIKSACEMKKRAILASMQGQPGSAAGTQPGSMAGPMGGNIIPPNPENLTNEEIKGILKGAPPSKCKCVGPCNPQCDRIKELRKEILASGLQSTNSVVGSNANPRDSGTQIDPKMKSNCTCSTVECMKRDN